MEEREIDSETDQDPSVLKLPAINWARYVGVKSVQYVKMGHAPRIAAEEQTDWNLEQAVRETEKNFSTDLQLLMTETTNDPSLLKTLVCLERQQQEMIPVFCKKHYIKLIYGTPYIHTPTGLVERGVRILKDNLLTNIKAGERFGKALDLSLDVMRKTPHTKLKKSAFELHYGRKPNTEISNLLNLDNLKNLTKNSISAKPDTLQVYSFSGVGGASDQLTMKTRKNDKGVSNQPFLFLEKNTRNQNSKVHIQINRI